ncbi:MAG: hypothetical protein AAF492_18885 [Verrucomicrobiota bacterium]
MNDERIDPMVSASRDMKQLKNNSAATAEELRNFMSELKGRSPAEMLGLVAQSSLFRSLISATFIFGFILVAATAIPYAWGKFVIEREPTASDPAAAVAETDEEDDKDEVAAKPEEQPATPAVEETKPENDVDDVLDKIGVGQQIPAPVSVNPLENTRDDLFDDIE